MRVNANMQGNNELVQRTQETYTKKQEGKNGHLESIDASGLKIVQDSILERKKQAMRDAMGIIRKQFEADSEIDQNLAERRSRIGENKEKANVALKEMQALEAEQEKLKETYGIKEGSQEQQDLELRMKFNEAMKPDSNVELTSEEMKRYMELGPVTEYEQQVMTLESSKGKWREEIDEAHKVIAEETQIIRGIKKELLKYHGMDDATLAAEETLKAASDAIVGMLMQEGLTHIQEEVDEAVEKGKELKEEKEQQEALMEEKKAERKEQAQQMAETPDLQELQGEVEQRIKEILEKQKLLEEDLKGIQVDGSI